MMMVSLLFAICFYTVFDGDVWLVIGWLVWVLGGLMSLISIHISYLLICTLLCFTLTPAQALTMAVTSTKKNLPQCIKYLDVKKKMGWKSIT